MTPKGMSSVFWMSGKSHIQNCILFTLLRNFTKKFMLVGLVIKTDFFLFFVCIINSIKIMNIFITTFWAWNLGNSWLYHSYI